MSFITSETALGLVPYLSHFTEFLICAHWRRLIIKNVGNYTVFFLHIFCKLLFCGTHIFFHPKTCLISMYTYKLLVKLLLSIEPFVGNIRDHASDFRSIYLYLYTSPVYVYTCCLARTLADCSPNSL